MPNYVQNILSFDGDQDQVSRLFSAIQGENGPMDFNKLIPMPPELEIEASSRTTAGLKKYMEFIVDHGFSTEREPAYLNAHLEIDREEWALGKQAFHNLQNFGYPTWYEWRNQNWGYQVERQGLGNLGWPAFFSHSLECAETSHGETLRDVSHGIHPPRLGR